MDQITHKIYKRKMSGWRGRRKARKLWLGGIDEILKKKKVRNLKNNVKCMKHHQLISQECSKSKTVCIRRKIKGCKGQKDMERTSE